MKLSAFCAYARPYATYSNAAFSSQPCKASDRFASWVAHAPSINLVCASLGVKIRTVAKGHSRHRLKLERAGGDQSSLLSPEAPVGGGREGIEQHQLRATGASMASAAPWVHQRLAKSPGMSEVRGSRVGMMVRNHTHCLWKTCRHGHILLLFFLG